MTRKAFSASALHGVKLECINTKNTSKGVLRVQLAFFFFKQQFKMKEEEFFELERLTYFNLKRTRGHHTVCFGGCIDIQYSGEVEVAVLIE